MRKTEIKNQLPSIARECYRKGPGYAPEAVVMRDVKRQMRPSSIETEQHPLDCWYELFREGKLVWGHDLDNPGSPFYHLAIRKRSVS